MPLLINDTSYSTIHVVGIFGAGMSALAQYLAWDGCIITGSDRLNDSPAVVNTSRALEACGCMIGPQDGSCISENTGCIVISTAIEQTNPDIKKALLLGIPVFHRSEVLAAIANRKKTIAIAGTSGKSTVTALVFHLLNRCGYSPSMISGANLNELVAQGMIGNAFYGKSDYLVIEADESDGSLVRYYPYVSLFLNVSKDHNPVEKTVELFSTLAQQSKHVIINKDDVLLQKIRYTKTFGMKNNADYHPDSFFTNHTQASITTNTIECTIPYPGKHSLFNLNASVALCSFLGAAQTDISRASISYSGIQRRFDVIPTKREITVIDDYAHNPEKIAAMLDTVESLSPRMIAIFQPHGFGPTRFMFDELVETFNTSLRSSDILILLPIYYAGGTASQDISSQHIADRLILDKKRVHVPATRHESIALIASLTQPGDIIISMGARDPSLPDYAKQIAAAVNN